MAERSLLILSTADTDLLTLSHALERLPAEFPTVRAVNPSTLAAAEDADADSPDERALFGELLAQGLGDVGRRLAPDDDNLFTWWAPWRNMRQRNIGWRIDYILASPNLAPLLRDAFIQKDVPGSDHAPIGVDLDPNAFDP